MYKTKYISISYKKKTSITKKAIKYLDIKDMVNNLVEMLILCPNSCQEFGEHH